MPKQLINISLTFEYQYEELENNFNFYEIKPIQDKFNILTGGKIGIAEKNLLQNFIENSNQENYKKIYKSDKIWSQYYIITKELMQEIREDKEDLEVYIKHAKKSLILLNSVKEYEIFAEKLKNKEMEVIYFLNEKNNPIAMFDISDNLLYCSNSICFNKKEDKNSQELMLLKKNLIEKQKQYNLFEQESFSLFLNKIEKSIENKIKKEKNSSLIKSQDKTPEEIMYILRELDEMILDGRVDGRDVKNNSKDSFLLKLNVTENDIYKKIGWGIQNLLNTINTNDDIKNKVMIRSELTLDKLIYIYLIKEFNIDKKLDMDYQLLCEDILGTNHSNIIDMLVKEKNYDDLNNALSTDKKIENNKLKI